MPEPVYRNDEGEQIYHIIRTTTDGRRVLTTTTDRSLYDASRSGNLTQITPTPQVTDLVKATPTPVHSDIVPADENPWDAVIDIVTDLALGSPKLIPDLLEHTDVIRDTSMEVAEAIGSFAMGIGSAVNTAFDTAYESPFMSGGQFAWVRERAEELYNEFQGNDGIDEGVPITNGLPKQLPPPPTSGPGGGVPTDEETPTPKLSTKKSSPTSKQKDDGGGFPGGQSTPGKKKDCIDEAKFRASFKRRSGETRPEMQIRLNEAVAKLRSEGKLCK